MYLPNDIDCYAGPFARTLQPTPTPVEAAQFALDQAQTTSAMNNAQQAFNFQLGRPDISRPGQVPFVSPSGESFQVRTTLGPGTGITGPLTFGEAYNKIADFDSCFTLAPDYGDTQHDPYAPYCPKPELKEKLPEPAMPPWLVIAGLIAAGVAL